MPVRGDLYKSSSAICVNAGLPCMQRVDGRFYSGQLTVGGVKSSDYIYVIICYSSKKITSCRAEDYSHLKAMFLQGSVNTSVHVRSILYFSSVITHQVFFFSHFCSHLMTLLPFTSIYRDVPQILRPF